MISNQIFDQDQLGLNIIDVLRYQESEDFRTDELRMSILDWIS